MREYLVYTSLLPRVSYEIYLHAGVITGKYSLHPLYITT